MRSLLLALVLSASPLAQADIIRCTFTEPFITVTYSMAQQKLTIVENIENKTQTQTGVSFQIRGAGKFELLDRQNKLVMNLDLNKNGSDGMSDNVYPYEVFWPALNLWGGCESNFLKATKLK